jgi:hypothetical protein
VAALTPPSFTLPSAETLGRLADVPYLLKANVATMHAAAQSEPSTGGNFDR